MTSSDERSGTPETAEPSTPELIGTDETDSAAGRMADRPGEAELCDRISRLIEGAPLLSADDFAKEALPLLMEADNELDRLTARLSEAERAPTYDHEWVSGIINQNNERGRRLSDYEQALREIVGHDGHHATESCVPQMVAVARAALSGSTRPDEPEKTEGEDGGAA